MLTFQESLLIFGVTILTCGSVGLLAVRLSNKMLKGLGWLGGAFAMGGGGALLFVFQNRISPVFGVALADLMVLAVFVLLHVGVLEMVESDILFPTFGVVLLLLQAGVSLLSLSVPELANTRMAFMGLCVAAQTTQTAVRLFRAGEQAMRTPAWFCAAVLVLFALFNTVRATAIWLGLPNHPHRFDQEEMLTLGIYLSVALGIAFCFFWMTTTMLSMGLERIATTDPLTRLFNRRGFLLWSDKEMVKSQRTGIPFSMLMIDIDHFKKINDDYGHAAGDMALCTAVERMQSAIRGIDVLARWGGEEFAAVLPNANHEAAMIVAERLRGNVERILMSARRIGEERKSPGLRLTVSVGIATYNGPADSVDAMLRRSDANLYQAKAAGRNRVLAEQELGRISA